MLVELKLKNFQRHEDLTVAFSGGLQVIRGASEAGKSTLYRGVAYAFFGSRALPKSLEKTVTWGRPVASLKVELTFTHGNDTFKITRSKSGAELVGPGVTASGQAEVTAFVERLFRANAAVAQATLLTNQRALQTGLDSSAVPLIEKLANMGLIDDLITSVQTKLPSGNTKVLEQQLASIDLEEPVLQDEELLDTITTLQDIEVDFRRNIQEVQAKLTATKVAADAHIAACNNNALADRILKALQSQYAQAASEALIVAEKPEDDIEALEQSQRDDAEATLQRKAWKVFNDNQITEFWNGTPTEFKAAADNLVSISANAGAKVRELSQEIGRLQGQIITETACGLCGKDLSNVPEVVEKNAGLTARIEALRAEVARQDQSAAEAHKAFRELKVWDEKSVAIERLPVSPYYRVCKDTVPFSLGWLGQVPSEDTGPRVDWAGLLKQARERLRAYELAEAARINAERRVLSLEKQIAEVVFTPVTEEGASAVIEVEALQDLLNKFTEGLTANAWKLNEACNELKTLEAVYATKKKAWQAGLEAKQQLEQLLVTTNFHNGIIAKLREARPVVARRLWSLVLTGVSHYFSAMRGSHSTVTRGESGFLVDGVEADSHSGSTQDILALAIRLMLQKTFLPNVNFMMVDEPGAACDSNREQEMLAMLSTCGMDQIILVTHSDLADTFAANVISI